MAVMPVPSKEDRVTDIRSRLIDCFAAAFADLSRENIPYASMYTVSSWDSLRTIMLFSLIEEEFALEVPTEDMEKFTSFDIILEYLERSISPADTGTRA